MTMTTEDMVLTFCSNVILIPWIALMFAPKWKHTPSILKVVVLLLCIVYTITFGRTEDLTILRTKTHLTYRSYYTHMRSLPRSDARGHEHHHTEGLSSALQDLESIPLFHRYSSRAHTHGETKPVARGVREKGKHAMSQKDGVMSMYVDMGTMDGLAKQFRDRGLILPAWVHYLAFDLVAALYVVQKNLADAHGLSKRAMAPCLLFIMMAGPMGMLMYVVLRNGRDLIEGKPPSEKVM